MGRDDNLSADALKVRIRTKYPAPEWATYTEVAAGIGAGPTRYADALACNLWPSRGFARHGFEVKVSRSDWLRELKAPEKADPIARYCHQWWIVVSDGAIVKDGELPAGWGLMAPSNGGLRVITKATPRTPDKPTEAFLAAILRRSVEQTPAEIDAAARRVEIERAVSAGIESRLEHMRLSYQRDLAAQHRTLARYHEMLDHINRGLGPSNRIDAWTRPERLEALGALAAAGIRGEEGALRALTNLRGLRERLAKLAAEVDATIDGEWQEPGSLGG